MFKKQITLLLSLFISISVVWAQVPAAYYDSAEGKLGYELKTELHNIIKDHNPRAYNQLWSDFQLTDKKSNGKVWDIYSDNPNGTPPYEYTFVTDQCGNYAGEADCYNREHSFPSSWFANEHPMQTDLFHIYPTDGWVNNKRANYTYGEVSSPNWTSLNGSKLGNCSYQGYSGRVFEPIDEYKGDLARTYFYMATRYEDKIANWASSSSETMVFMSGTPGQAYKEWFINMMIEWHLNDPVSEKEINRNNAVYQLQNNRNPFIDRPEWVIYIWRPWEVIAVENSSKQLDYYHYLDNAQSLNINFKDNMETLDVEVFNVSGQSLYNGKFFSQSNVKIDMQNFTKGVYIVRLKTDTGNSVFKIIR